MRDYTFSQQINIQINHYHTGGKTDVRRQETTHTATRKALPRGKKVKSLSPSRRVVMTDLPVEAARIPAYEEYVPEKKQERLPPHAEMETVSPSVSATLPVFAEYEKPSLFSRIAGALIPASGKKLTLIPHATEADALPSCAATGVVVPDFRERIKF